MNNTTKSSLSISLLLLVGAALFLGACGPEMEDPAFLAQAASMDADSASQDEDRDSAMTDLRNKAMPQDQEDNQAAPQPMVGAVGAAAAVVKLPPRYAQLPTRVVPNAPTLTTTGEQRVFERDILVEQPVINDQANVNTHVINNHVNTNTKYHTTVYNRQTFANRLAMTASASATAEVLPTTEVQLPSIVAPAVGVGIGVGVYGPSIPYNWGWNPTWGVVPGSLGGRPGCARYLSGGFHRRCL